MPMQKTPALLGVLAVAAVSGCAQITVTADTVVDGVARVADATTNAVAGTSDVTSDTAQDIDSSTHQARLAFVDSQLVLLRREAAAGGGQHVQALAKLMGEQDSKSFARALQANYGAIFVGDQNAEQVLQKVYTVIGLPADMRQG